MRTLLTLALLACAASPAAAQTVYYYSQGYSPYSRPAYGGAVVTSPYYSRQSVVVSTPRTYVTAQPRVAYSYTPYTYSQPSYSYSQPSYSSYSYSQPTYSTFSYPQSQTYAYSTPTYYSSTPSYSSYVSPTSYYSQPMVYSTPTYATSSYYSMSPYSSMSRSYLPASSQVYSQPMTWGQPSYSQAMVWSQPSYYQPMAWGQSSYSQPMIWSQPTTSWSGASSMAYYPSYSQPRYDTMSWSQPSYSSMPSYSYSSMPSYYSTPTMTYVNPSYGYQSVQGQNVLVNNPYQGQPSFNFAPSGGFDQRLMTAPPQTRGYAGQWVPSYYR